MDMQQYADIVWCPWELPWLCFMQPGLRHGGNRFTRAKNAGNIIMKNFVDYMIGSILLCVGFAVMFGGDGAFIGTSGF